MLKAGAHALKTHGVNGIGVDGLAAAAGVTSGAFYSNFTNKEAMLEAVVEAGVGEPLLSDTDSSTVTELRAIIIDFLGRYISADHSADPGGGCAMPALSADVSRARPVVKEAYERKMIALVDRIGSALGGDESDRQRRAWSVVAGMVGAILISRGLPEDSDARATLLQSALETALAQIADDVS